MRVFEQDGKFYVSYSDELRRGIIPDLNEVSNWCRSMWGDTDHRTNPDYKWRRRMFDFSFSRESHRTLFLMQFANKEVA